VYACVCPSGGDCPDFLLGHGSDGKFQRALYGAMGVLALKSIKRGSIVRQNAAKIPP
jgi:hypothetical protein